MGGETVFNIFRAEAELESSCDFIRKNTDRARHLNNNANNFYSILSVAKRFSALMSPFCCQSFVIKILYYEISWPAHTGYFPLFPRYIIVRLGIETLFRVPVFLLLSNSFSKVMIDRVEGFDKPQVRQNNSSSFPLVHFHIHQLLTWFDSPRLNRLGDVWSFFGSAQLRSWDKNLQRRLK